MVKTASESSYIPRFLERYKKELSPALKKDFGYANSMAIPKLVKIVLNIGCGEASHDAKVLEEAQKALAMISGQKPVVTRAKKAISEFKIKEGDAVGVKVTLRKQKMYEFLDRLVSVALPRIRDFRGLSSSAFDHAGSYSFGIKEQTIFPEINIDQVHYTLGMDITIVTTAKNAKEARALLEGFGVPFEKS